MPTKTDIKRIIEINKLVEENYYAKVFRPPSTQDAIDLARQVVKHCENKSLKITFEFQTGSVEGIKNHKIVLN